MAEVEQVLKIDQSLKPTIAEDKQFSAFKSDRKFKQLIYGSGPPSGK